MIEAELKARVKDVEAVRTWLRARAEEEEATYHDTYYDWPDHRLDAEGREIRLRTIITPINTINLLTYKQPPSDTASGSKPEHETAIGDPDAVSVLLRDLRMVELVSLTKHCQNFRFEYDGRQVLCTLVTVPELDGIFLEVETQSEENDLDSSLVVVKSILGSMDLLGSLVTDAYTDSVMQVRRDLQRCAVRLRMDSRSIAKNRSFRSI